VTLDLASIPLAGAAGALSILSPCVWPLVPAVMSAAATGGRLGPWYLGLGLAVSFAFAGTVLSFLLLSLALDPQVLRPLAAGLLVVIAVVLIVPSAAQWLTGALSRLTANTNVAGFTPSGPAGQFAVGALLGLVWLPCVGPTLGAAIALASLGERMASAFMVMLAFGIGTASVLVLAGLASKQALGRWRSGIVIGAERGKKILGVTLLVVATLVVTGADKVLEALALQMLPSWAISI
jgi:cytochrome c-type biogenesis protein